MTTQQNTNDTWTPEDLAAYKADLISFHSGPRTDIHRPSAINPDGYLFVCVNYTPGAAEGELGELQYLQEQREFLRLHMARTGGKWSTHQHGGNCHVCGAHAMYTVTFHHVATNVYIRTGFDCAEKMEMGDPEMFRSFQKIHGVVKGAREAAKGKRKAFTILQDAELLTAWAIYTEPEDSVRRAFKNEEMTVCDMVGNLVRYGSISDKALGYLRNLLGRITDRPALEAKKAAELAAAADCPAGRVEITGEVVSLKTVDTAFGSTLKMLVKHATGYKVWGTVPANLTIERGAVVSFTATVERSKDDRTFGFYSRPSKARVDTPAVPNA